GGCSVMPFRPIEAACLPRLAALYQALDSFASEARLPFLFHHHAFLTRGSTFVVNDSDRTIFLCPFGAGPTRMFVPTFQELFRMADVNAAVFTQDCVDVEWTLRHWRRLVHHPARDLVFLLHDCDCCDCADARAA